MRHTQFLKKFLTSYKRFLLLFFLICTIAFAASGDYVYIKLKELHYKKNQSEPVGLGHLIAQSFELKVDNVSFAIDNAKKDFFSKIKFDGQNISLQSEFINFAVQVEQPQDLGGVEVFKVNNGVLKIENQEVQIVGDSLEVVFNQMFLNVFNADVACSRSKDPAKDIDVPGIISACFNNSVFSPDNDTSKPSKLVFEYKGQDDPFKVTSIFESVRLDKFDFYAKSPTFQFEYNGLAYLFKGANLRCGKPYIKDEIIFDDFAKGCLNDSEVSAKEFSILSDDLTTVFEIEQFQFRPDKMFGKAPNTIFHLDRDQTILRNLHLYCMKDSGIASFDLDLLIPFCIKEAVITASSLLTSEEYKGAEVYKILAAEGKIPLQEKILKRKERIKDLKLISQAGEFTFEFALNSLGLSLPGKIQGQVNYLSQKEALHFKVQRATLSYLPAKNLVLYVLKQFLSSSAFQVKGNDVYIFF